MQFDKVPSIAKHLSLVFMLTWLGSNTVWMFLPIFFEKHIANVFLVGVLTSLPPLLALFLDIPMGNLVQRAGEKVVIFVGLVLQLMPGLFYLTGAPLFIVVGRAFEGIVKSMIWNGGWSMSLKSGDEDNESETQSVFLLGANLAAVVGPMIGGFLIASRGFDVTFALWILTAWLAVLVFYLYIGLEGKRGFFDSMEDLLNRKTYANDLQHLEDNWHNIKFPLLLIFLYSIIFTFFWLAVPLLLDDIGASYELMGIVFGFAALPSVFQFLFARWADKVGWLRTVSILSLLLVPVLVLMGLTTSIYAVAVFFLVARLLSDGISPALHAFFDSRAPEEIEGELTGFWEFSKHIGQAAGPIMAGTIASVWSINVSFFGAAFVAALIFVITLVASRN